MLPGAVAKPAGAASCAESCDARRQQSAPAASAVNPPRRPIPSITPSIASYPDAGEFFQPIVMISRHFTGARRRSSADAEDRALFPTPIAPMFVTSILLVERCFARKRVPAIFSSQNRFHLPVPRSARRVRFPVSDRKESS